MTLLVESELLLSSVLQKIESRTAKVGVVGLGLCWFTPGSFI